MDGSQGRIPGSGAAAAGVRRAAGRQVADGCGRRVPLDEPLLDCVAAAALLGVRASWVRDAARLGQVPCLRLGRHIGFSRGALEAWLADRQQAAPAAASTALRAAQRNRRVYAPGRARREREGLIAGLERPARVDGEGS